MSPPRQSASGSIRPLRRAKIACKACNARRVRCDVVQSHPCWHCRNRDTICELAESRRGKYDRSQRDKRVRGTTSTTSTRQQNEAGVTNGPLAVQMLADLGLHQDEGCVRGQNLACQKDVSSQQPIQAQCNANPTLPALPLVASSTGNDVTSAIGSDTDDQEMLYARMTNPESLDHDNQGQEGEGNIFYLGEPYSLTFVVKTVCSPSGDGSGPLGVHHPVPPFKNHSPKPSETNHPVDHATLTSLKSQGALTIPSQRDSDALVQAYFKSFHPAYPVLDRSLFESRYSQGTMSLIVLHTVYLMAVTVCDDTLLEQANLGSRSQARATFYSRAKALYDADYETDHTLLTASLFLLGFCWQKPREQKDSWHWLGCAISLAQTRGMHRSTALSGMSPRTRSLWKRIWWSIYVRDRHAAAGLGRPVRINDDDCDVEELCEMDFGHDQVSGSPILGKQEKFHTSYAINMSTLAGLLGKVLAAKFSPKNTQGNVDLVGIYHSLRSWEQQLPSSMLIQPLGKSSGAPFWASMLHASYHNTIILLCRPTRISIESENEEEWDQHAKYSADATTRIAEDLLTAGVLREGQLHLIPAIFAAMAIHAIVIRRNVPVQRQLAENRSRQCMLALGELSKSWPVGDWIFRLFASLMRKLTGYQTEAHAAVPTRQVDRSTGEQQGDQTYLPGTRSGNAEIMQPTQSLAMSNPTHQGFDLSSLPLDTPFQYLPSLDQTFSDYDFMFQNPFSSTFAEDLSITSMIRSQQEQADSS